MPDWKLTATTVFCEEINDEVTIMVYKDGKTRCTGYDAFSKNALKSSGGKAKNTVGCSGPVCSRVAAYKDKLFYEESSK
jgi:hypothetical protein